MVSADSDSALLDYLFRSSLRLVVLDRDGAIEWITPQAAAMLVPLSPDGRLDNLFDLLAPHVPGLRGLVEGARGPVVSSGMSFGVPWEPQPRIYSLDLQRVERHRLLAILSDVTEAEQHAVRDRMQSLADRLLAEARLLARDDLLKRLASQVPGVLFQLQRDPDGRLHLPFVSRAVADLFGVSEAEARADAQAWLHRIDPDHRPAFIASMEASAATLQTWSNTFRGGSGWRQVQAQPLRQGDGSTVWFGFIADISQQIDAEEHLRQLNESLEARVEQRTRELAVARDAAERANRSRGEFLAKMSHEIRTPLNAILGMTHLAIQASPDERLRGRLQTIQQSGQHLLGVISDILDFSKIDAGKLDLECQPFSLGAVLESSLALVAQRAREKGLVLSVQVDPGLSDHLDGDARRLQQVVLNLLNNAVTYTERGSVRVAVNPVPDRPGLLCFSVIDTGIGLNEEQQSRLFRSFEQADNSMSRRFGGTGLGLAICKQLAELMRGEVGVRSDPGQGSTFWFTAWLPPVASAPASDPLPVPAASSPPSVPRGAAEVGFAEPPASPQTPPCAGEPGTAIGFFPVLRGRRVLLVDDNAFNQIITQEILEAEGLVVTVAGDGHEALGFLQGHDPFDVVLMDVQMPDLDGLETTRRFRASGLRPGLPVIAMTAHARMEDRETCEAAGMDDFVTKPVDPARLCARLVWWLGRPAQPPG